MHPKTLTRHDFLQLCTGLAALGTVPFVAGCPAPDDTGACDMDPDVTIAGNHGHMLDVPLADVADGDRVTYDIRGSADHTHTVTLSAEDFERLQGGGEVTVSSSVEDGHSHEITARCG
jgi:hypothetical protein